MIVLLRMTWPVIFRHCTADCARCLKVHTAVSSSVRMANALTMTSSVIVLIIVLTTLMEQMHAVSISFITRHSWYSAALNSANWMGGWLISNAIFGIRFLWTYKRLLVVMVAILCSCLWVACCNGAVNLWSLCLPIQSHLANCLNNKATYNCSLFLTNGKLYMN